MDQHNLVGTWPQRTVHRSQQLVATAASATTRTKWDETLHEQSLQACQNVFHEVMPDFFPVYLAVSADPLHQIEQGIFGKHIWPWIHDQLSKRQATILDSHFKNMPQHPNLKHFPNGVAMLRNITGTEHGIILCLLAPLVEDLIPTSHRKLTMDVLHSLAQIHLLAKFTTHTEVTLEQLDQEIEQFGNAYQKLAKQFQSLSLNFPKLHSLSHLTNIIWRKSTTDNYHTGLGEALHPQS
ncbi:hypothetical protein FRC06_002315 [Ceratobasidium sp. 370]|nr:hypothetical protein FRC06_002315 [Ceratobasidium sp. 370]